MTGPRTEADWPDTATPIWMVWRDSLNGVITFGPFRTRADAEAFAGSEYGGHVFDWAAQRRSATGPWYP